MTVVRPQPDISKRLLWSSLRGTNAASLTASCLGHALYAVRRRATRLDLLGARATRERTGSLQRADRRSPPNYSRPNSTPTAPVIARNVLSFIFAPPCGT